MDIYVGNLAYEATEEDLLATFEPYGVVESVTIIKDRIGRPKGFAFVKMIDREEVKAAIVGTNGRPLRGRPLRVMPHEAPGEKRPEAERLGNPHLHGTREANGYRVRAADGDAGQVADLMIDSQGWEISHLVLDLGNWLPGKKVLVPTAEIIETRRDELAISVELSQTEIENSPVFAAARLDSGQDTEASGSSGKRKGKKN